MSLRRVWMLVVVVDCYNSLALVRDEVAKKKAKEEEKEKEKRGRERGRGREREGRI